MSDTLATVLVILVLFVGLPVLLLRLRDRRRQAQWRRDRRPATASAERGAYERRLLAPDWNSVERHLRRGTPQALRELYADRSLIVRQDVRYNDDIVISTFEPLDEAAMVDPDRFVQRDAVVIAVTDFGDAIHLRPGATEPDIVYVTHHDGGDTDTVAASISEFVDNLRRSRDSSEFKS